jgi:hypothetical protein
MARTQILDGELITSHETNPVAEKKTPKRFFPYITIAGVRNPIIDNLPLFECRENVRIWTRYQQQSKKPGEPGERPVVF